MKLIIDFYKSLDTINLILFWGIIIVIILLLIFSIIILNKNKKLKQMLILNQKNNSPHETFDIPIINENNISVNNNQTIEISPNEESKIDEEKEFVAEEHVINYNTDPLPTSNIIENTSPISPPQEPYQNAPYQRNVLREMSLNQTSPIGIIIKDNDSQKNLNNAKELQKILENEIETTNKEIQPKNQEIYLNEVSKKLNEASNMDNIARTEYELKQEQDAIISFKELMSKKDSLNIIEEEDAVISIEELMNRKNKNEKLYNITKEEENDEFISELKHFRNDL